MNRQIRKLGAVVMALYLVLFVQLNRIQVFGAKRLEANANNTRDIARDFGKPRGSIITADGQLLVRSLPVDEAKTAYRREYLQGELFAHVTGYFSLALGSTGVESQYNDELSGQAVKQKYRTIADLFLDRDTTADVTITLRSDLQAKAAEMLAGRKGSVTVVDTRTGEILAMYSNPTYSPAPLADLSTKLAEDASRALVNDPAKPTLSRAYREVFAPGSTFKVVTAAAGIEAGVLKAETPVYEAAQSYTPPNVLDDFAIFNFNRSRCGGTIFDVLRVSCNSAFARMGAEHVGADRMIERSQAFGFNAPVPIDLPAPAQSRFPTSFGKRLETIESYYARKAGLPRPTTTTGPPGSPKIEPVYVVENSGGLAQSSIGQNDVAATPLQMALIAAAAVNNGVIMTPHVMKEVRETNGDLVRAYKPTEWRRAVSPETAELLRQMMRDVAENGTAQRMFVPGLDVGGKTGTAQLGDQPSSHAWIIGFAGIPGEIPEIALSVLVEAQPGASEQTGGQVAAPIAKALIETYFRR